MVPFSRLFSHANIALTLSLLEPGTISRECNSLVLSAGNHTDGCVVFHAQRYIQNWHLETRSFRV